MLVEFLGLKHREAFTESKLEQAILDHLEHFLMEMGKGYALVDTSPSHYSCHSSIWDCGFSFLSIMIDCILTHIVVNLLKKSKNIA